MSIDPSKPLDSDLISSWPPLLRETRGVAHEVVAARGTQPSLDARLSVALTPGGELKVAPPLSFWTLEENPLTRLNGSTILIHSAVDQTDNYPRGRSLKVGEVASWYVLSAVFDSVNVYTVLTVVGPTLPSVNSLAYSLRPDQQQALFTDELLTSTGGSALLLEPSAGTEELVSEGVLNKRAPRQVGNMADLKTTPRSFDGQQVELLGYYVDTPGQGGGSFFWATSQSRSAHNGGTIIDPTHSATPGTEAWYTAENAGLGCWVRRIDTIIDIASFGPIAPSVHIAINKAIDTAINTNKTIYSWSGVTYTVEGTLNFRGCRDVDVRSTIIGTGEFIPVLAGGYSTNTQQYYTQRFFKVNRGSVLPAIRIVGMNKGAVHIGEASYVQMYADTDSSTNGGDEYCAYNKVYIKSTGLFEIDSNPDTDGSIVQWVNENKIYLDFCLNARIVDRGYQHNGNNFFGGNFESNTSEIDLQTGLSNIFHNVRGEDSLSVRFGENCSNSGVFINWVGYKNGGWAGSVFDVDDKGSNNYVKNVHMLYTQQFVIAGCNGTTLKTDGTKTNLLGFNPALVVDSENNTITGGNATIIYDGPLVRIDKNKQFFNVSVINKLSGGIRMKVIGYDENMNIITPTGEDVFYKDTGLVAFAEWNTSITNSSGANNLEVVNASARWIKFLVLCSSSGCSFRGFSIVAVSSSAYPAAYVGQPYNVGTI